MRVSVVRRVLWTAFVLVAGGLLAGVLWASRPWPDTSVEVAPTEENAARDAAGKSTTPTVMVLARDPGRRVKMPEGASRGWPTLLGPMLDGTSEEKGLKLDWPETGPIEKWRVEVGTGYAAPVVLGDAVVLIHRQDGREVVECFAAESGHSRWRFSWTATYQGSHSYSSGPYSTPVLESGRVYLIGPEGETYCLRLDDGGVLWHRNLHGEYDVRIEIWPATASPLIEGNRLILNLGGNTREAGVIGLDKATGQTLWTSTSDGASCSTPRGATIHGKRHVFVWTAEALVSLDPADGAVRWRIPFAANNHEAAHGATPLVADDVVLVSGYQIGNLCVRVLPDGSCRELWRDNRKLLDCQYNNLLHIDDTVCGFSSTRKKMRCLDLLTGEMRWQWRSSKIRLGTTIAVDGGYLVLSERGYLASLRMGGEGPSVRAITQRPVLAAPAMSYPALCNGLLYLRNEEELVCLDLRQGADAE